jgi:hypothetical protein
MPLHRLASLDRRNIAIELLQNGQKKTMHGKAVYGHDPDLGAVLTISVKDACGEFDFVLREEEFEGEISASTEPNCDYRIALAVGCECLS